MAKVLWISDSLRIPYVGQSVVSRNIIARLKAKHQIIQLGFGEDEITKVKPETKQTLPDISIIPARRGGVNEEEKKQGVMSIIDCNDMEKVINCTHPEVVIFSHDPWLFSTLPHLKAKFPNIKFIGYVTIDGEPAYWKWYDTLKPYDKIVSPAFYGKKVIEDRWADLKVDVIPYGIDFNQYHYPKNGKEELRKQIAQVTRGKLNLVNKFVAIFVGANQDRKNLGLQYEAWKRFEKNKADVTFLLFTHSAAISQQIGVYDLGCFMQDTKNLILIPQDQPDNMIAASIAASDVLIHPANGEGFGLTICSAMAAGTVPIVFNFSGHTDFCNEKNSYFCPYTLHVGGFHTHRAVGSFEDYTACIQRAYDNREELKQKSLQGVEDVKKYTWETCVDMWDKAIEEVLKYDSNALRVTRLV